jgi:hypothetical protein
MPPYGIAQASGIGKTHGQLTVVSVQAYGMGRPALYHQSGLVTWIMPAPCNGDEAGLDRMTQTRTHIAGGCVEHHEPLCSW